ncbi:hypothetical protein PHLCEN_2v6225 [Hermanssonia centrifuga]|uniref:C2H2-type domain-containing protein n=1 Tax=Hermanssonia centrifuga TaxID=98765 RepID=A0A2R6P016_9APHY|nr:hypothetical protein PHLCEN_2v6225 [Hermanssonia centrifuga]
MPDDNTSGRVSPKLIQPPFVHHDGELVEFTKAGNISRMRSHRGNKPAIPQTQLCHLCPAKFTRITHLHRHLRTQHPDRYVSSTRDVIRSSLVVTSSLDINAVAEIRE